MNEITPRPVTKEHQGSIDEMRATVDRMALTLSAFEAKQGSEQDKNRKERAYLDFLNDLATAIAFSVAGAYTIRHPKILFDNLWLAAVCGTLVYFLGAIGASAAASQYINVLYFERRIERRRRWIVLFTIIVIMVSCYLASWLVFRQPPE